MSETISREENPGNRGKLPSTTKRYRTYSVNSDYFKEWNQDMAYILGFTATDGCIRINNDPIYKDNGSIKTYKGIYQVMWSCTDREVLEFIKDQLETGHPIKDRPISYYTNVKNPKPQWYITISNKEMVNDLALCDKKFIRVAGLQDICKQCKV